MHRNDLNVDRRVDVDDDRTLRNVSLTYFCKVHKAVRDYLRTCLENTGSKLYHHMV